MNSNWATNYYGAAAVNGGIGNPPHNCTLYAAWMLAVSGLPDPKRTWGDAAQWGHTLASQTNSVPSVGSIAWYDAGRSGVGTSGHVAYVASVNQSNGTVFLISDNYLGGNSGYTSNGWVNISSPSGYIHFSDASSSAGNLAVNGGFETGSAWTPIGGANIANYSSGQVAGESSRDGQRYEATNASQAGGGIYQDVPLSTVPGETICGSAWVRTQSPQTGASGSFVLWLLGGSYNDSGTVSFSNLGNHGNWTQVQTCVESTIAHTTLRIQFYPSTGAPTLEVDDVDVH
jgi:surface antigen